MLWPQSYRLPKWILSAAAMSLLAAPPMTMAQSEISPATGKPTPKPVIKAVSAKKVAAPSVPPAEEQVERSSAILAEADVVEGETAVQRELRRLYHESGREAPDVPTPAQVQRVNGRTPVAQPMAPLPAQQAPYGTYGAAPPRTGAAPAASAPTRTSRNPITAFFQRITPGSKPVSPAASPAPITRPVPPNPALARQAAQPPAKAYAPYNGTQPKRLNEQPARPAAAAVAATPPQPKSVPVGELPPGPINLAEKLELDGAVATSAPAQAAATSVVVPVTPKVVAAPPTLGPVITGPSAPAAFTARPTQDEEPVFEAPVIVDGTEATPFEEPEVTTATSDMPVAAAESEASKGEFEPFTEEAEKAADTEAMESPFSGLALDEEPIVAKPIPVEADPLADTASDPQPLTIPSAATPAVPAPTTVAIEPEGTAKVGAAPLAVPQPTEKEDDEFFPADVAKPMEAARTTNDPVLTLPNDPTLAKPIAPTGADAAEYAVKMQKIKDRGGMKGLKGFCPVTLRDDRELKDAKPEFHSQYRGQKFHFASTEAKAKFDQAPAGYAPAAYGADVVVLIRDKDVAEGTLDFAAWFKGQLYLFSSEENHAVFTNDPAKFAAPVGIE